MFLNKNNTIKWKFLFIGASITIFLCLMGIFFWDKSLFLFFRKFDSQIWYFFEVIFDSKIWLIVFSFLSIIFFIKGFEKSNDKQKFSLRNKIHNVLDKIKKNTPFIIFCSVFFAVITTGLLKFLIGRSRPVFFEALDKTVFLPFTNEWVFNSMPSGHATAGFAGLVMIGLLFPKYKWVTWTIAIIIGVSRVAIGDHFPSDVLLGAFIGMVSADFTKYIFFKKIK